MRSGTGSSCSALLSETLLPFRQLHLKAHPDAARGFLLYRDPSGSVRLTATNVADNTLEAPLFQASPTACGLTLCKNSVHPL
jgi:hypothetical protein